jgi:hypothetical protein
MLTRLYFVILLMKVLVYLSLFAAIVAWGCQKEDQEPLKELIFSFGHEVNGEKVFPDTLMHPHAGGYLYGISRLEYFISNIRLLTSKGEVWEIDGAYYVNAFRASTHILESKLVPEGRYKGLAFYIGLPEALNQSGALPTTLENLNMAWPDQMGGGYHFLKLEGKYGKEGEERHGYAFHLGENLYLVEVKVEGEFWLKEKENGLKLVMDIAEWLQNPYLIDFEKHGSHSMYDDALKQKLAANGSSVFRIKP